MAFYKAIIAYDGTDFAGWQVQPSAETVASALQNTFLRVFGEKISILGASRTDAGVHALSQVTTFESNVDAPIEKMLRAWNAALPEAIVIRLIEEIPKRINPCFDAKQKTYYYHIFTKRPLPMWVRYGWFPKQIRNFDLKKFKEALKIFSGEHDFRSFCKIEKGEERETIRTVDSIEVERCPQMRAIRVVIRGKGFLRFQIRRMVGYALDVACRSDVSVSLLRDILENPCPEQNLVKADAKGLCLRKIVYEPDVEL
ncbi:tRNA pseudouridine(38-40) synthase TruA [bacterium]|nr:tRNA pseudouridine(38-40) synthase TruA [bacterium]